MATFQPRGGKWRAIVRRKGFATKTRTFPTKTAAKAWADRLERDLADQEARGGTEDNVTIAGLIEWHEEAVEGVKARSKTQIGNLTRIEEGLGEFVARKLTAADVIEHARRRVHGEHMMANGKVIPAVKPATMTVELGYLAELLKLAKGMRKGFAMAHDPVNEARSALRLLGLVAKSRLRDRRPTEDELRRIREYYDQQAWRMRIPMNDIIDFAIATAKRESEIFRLFRADLDATDKSCLLRDVKHPRKKMGNHKRFPLINGAWEIVDRQPIAKGDDRIFPFDSKSVGASFTRACAKLGIEDLHFHDLRHEGTSRLFEQGYDIPQVASVTLHTSWNELKRYTHLMPKHMQRPQMGPAAEVSTRDRG